MDNKSKPLPKRFNISTKDDSSCQPWETAAEPTFIGSVVPPPLIPPEKAAEVLKELWMTWREVVEEPDCDTDFVTWLIQERGWSEVDSEEEDVTLEW